MYLERTLPGSEKAQSTGPLAVRPLAHKSGKSDAWQRRFGVSSRSSAIG